MSTSSWEETIKYAVSRVAKDSSLETIVVDSIIGTIKDLLHHG